MDEKKWTPWLVIGKDCGEESIVRLGYLNLAGGSNNNHYVRLVLDVIGTEALRAKEAEAEKKTKEAQEEKKLKAKEAEETKKLKAKKVEEEKKLKAKKAEEKKLKQQKREEQAAEAEEKKLKQQKREEQAAEIGAANHAHQNTKSAAEGASNVTRIEELEKETRAKKAEEEKKLKAKEAEETKKQKAKKAQEEKKLKAKKAEETKKTNGEMATKKDPTDYAPEDYNKACDHFNHILPQHLCKVISFSFPRTLEIVRAFCSCHCSYFLILPLVLLLNRCVAKAVLR